MFKRTVIRWGMLAILVIAAAVYGIAEEKVEDPGLEPIVSTRSYWRFHLTFRPIHCLDPWGKLRLRGKVRRYAAFLGGDHYHQLTTDPPPENWMKADFNDSEWPVVRMPLDMPRTAGGRLAKSPDAQFVRRMCVRTRFLVPKPRTVKKLKLKIAYYGGAIAWVNGHEVGRGHIPSSGALGKEYYAESYPLEAYEPVDPKHVELAKKHKFITPRQYMWKVVPLHKDRWRYDNDNYYAYHFDRRMSLYNKMDKEAQEITRWVNNLRRRTFEVEVPVKLLVAGVNVLSIEKRCSPLNEARKHRQAYWSHGSIDKVELHAIPEGSVLSADRRPKGVQVWAEDIHRWMMPESFLEPGVRERRVLRLACPRNSTCSGQVVIGTTGELKNPSVKKAALTGPGGSKIPASAMTVRWARPIDIGVVPKSGRGSREGFTLLKQRVRPSRSPQSGKTRKRRRKAKPLEIFDPLMHSVPASIPPNTSRTVWLTVKIPANAVPGRYTGTVTVSANGMRPVTMNIQLYVFGWTLPVPQEYVAYSGIDESPWSLAEWAKVKPWSPEHWKLVEDAMAWAGKLGARVAGVPVIHNSDMRNGKDPMVTWIKKGKNSYDYDFTLMDRYLKLWRTYCHKDSDVIVYLTLSTTRDGYYTSGGPPGMVTVRNPGTGQETPFSPMGIEERVKKYTSTGYCSKAAYTPPGRDDPGIRLMVDFAKAVRAHLNELGFNDNQIHWGMFHDKIEASSRALADVLVTEIPKVGWARVSHLGTRSKDKALAGTKAFVSWDAAIRGAMKGPFSMKCERKREGKRRYSFGIPGTYKVLKRKGWSNPTHRLALGRNDSDNMCFSLYTPLWQIREAMELPITTTYRGISRFSIDGWGRQGYYGPYMSMLTYPDRTGKRMDGSVQFEALREGLQEAEARVFLEKIESLPAGVQKVLDFRTERVWIAPGCGRGLPIMEFHYGWQQSSWDLYAAAARISGGKAPGRADKETFFNRE